MTQDTNNKPSVSDKITYLKDGKDIKIFIKTMPMETKPQIHDSNTALIKIILIISSILWIAFLAVSLVPLFTAFIMSSMVPGVLFLTLLIIASMWASAILPWVFYERGKYKWALIYIVLPMLICIGLIIIICFGEYFYKRW